MEREENEKLGQKYLLCDRQFDKEFDKIDLLERYPWVGCAFAKSSCRPLILGDSHYTTDKDRNFSQEEYDTCKSDKNYTRGIINCVIDKKCKGKTTWKMYEGLLKTFMEISPENVKSFWSKVAFYNFIQEPMKHIDEKPSDNYIEDGWKCLRDVIEVLHPTSILMIGVRNEHYSDRINGKDIKLEDFKNDNGNINGCIPRIGKIIFGNETIPITLIKHTSQGYSYDSWHDYLKKRDPEMMHYLLK